LAVDVLLFAFRQRKHSGGFCYAAVTTIEARVTTTQRGRRAHGG